MSLNAIKQWVSGEILTASDLNAEFANVRQNGTDLISPLTGAVDGNYNHLLNIITTHTVQTFTASDETPSVASGTVFKTNNSVSTTISMFDGGTNGQEIFVLINDANTILDFTGTNLKGNAGSNWSPTTGDGLRAIFISPNWYCHIIDMTA